VATAAVTAVAIAVATAAVTAAVATAVANSSTLSSVSSLGENTTAIVRVECTGTTFSISCLLPIERVSPLPLYMHYIHTYTHIRGVL